MLMKLFRIVKRAASDFINEDCMSSGAAIAYYTIFSLPPLLVIVFSAADAMGVSHATVHRIVSQQIGLPLEAEAGEGNTDAADPDPNGSGRATMSGIVSAAGKESEVKFAPLGPLTKLFGGVILLFSASGVFGHLQAAINKAWDVAPAPDKGGILDLVIRRLLSFGMVVVIAFLLFVSLIMTTMIDETVRWTLGETAGTTALIVGVIVNDTVALILSALLFAAMFKFLPDAKIHWRDVAVGSLMTAVLFVLGKSLLGWYLQIGNIGNTWGAAAASMVGVLVWVYYSSLLVLFGAELTQAWSIESGRGIEPSENAIRVLRKSDMIADDEPAEAEPKSPPVAETEESPPPPEESAGQSDTHPKTNEAT